MTITMIMIPKIRIKIQTKKDHRTICLIAWMLDPPCYRLLRKKMNRNIDHTTSICPN